MYLGGRGPGRPREHSPVALDGGSYSLVATAGDGGCRLQFVGGEGGTFAKRGASTERGLEEKYLVKMPTRLGANSEEQPLRGILLQQRETAIHEP